jgi:hypothetical protein
MPMANGLAGPRPHGGWRRRQMTPLMHNYNTAIQAPLEAAHVRHYYHMNKIFITHTRTDF